MANRRHLRPDLDEPFSLFPLDPEEGLRRLLGADDVPVTEDAEPTEDEGS